ncbi:TPA: hypothetical protein SMN35_001137 [Proteus mirabilis]
MAKKRRSRNFMSKIIDRSIKISEAVSEAKQQLALKLSKIQRNALEQILST